MLIAYTNINIEDMRKLMTIFGLALGSLLFSQATYAQELAPDQNPNYRVSMVKYMAQKDSLTATLSTTVQDTYKAYDWYEAKMERKAQKKQWRHEERMARAKYGRSYYSYDNGYYGNYNRYYSGWNNWNTWRPNIGFRTGNWWFSI
ncbi:hypothetical protein HX045_04380 [Myroides odoratimimus]|uniref:Uncharacterized protein n=4 Tax=Flavobacteriaceae TaxID=49546 RepID=A0A0S7E6Q3_9FLAO|nr:hypothetical protein MYRA21_1587 [Myroides sp. A21]ALU26001.1 hypothetical protein AS202_07520 [Myroides odoratimimus]APA92048.1 hypothetical protein BK054_07400 [Myroides sp. ZB35]EHO11105.1 hypothetical protein HMPREF9712_00762 [Myroides odoratimimus CCUG 10230]EHO14254.1 hypothetical protein HMPREF9714_00516 [Myroides odoratimimus CCUG 12901]EHO14639.1 hypothetical protein HMPREF9715_00524 [Myroides odoratimimus CIP 101113]EPH09930.1 hypothetical protein HMPREF9713_02591 [Myroides odora